MAFVLPYLGYFLYKLLLKKTGKRKLSAAIGSYVGINAAAFCAAVELEYSLCYLKMRRTGTLLSISSKCVYTA